MIFKVKKKIITIQLKTKILFNKNIKRIMNSLLMILKVLKINVSLLEIIKFSKITGKIKIL